MAENKVNLLLGRLQGVRGKEGTWIAQCPAHEDKTPSLSVGLGDDGRILIHCHAGCGAIAVVESLGLQLSDLMPDDPAYFKRRGARPRVDYRGLVFHLRHEFYALSIMANKVKEGEMLTTDEETTLGRVAKSFERMRHVG